MKDRCLVFEIADYYPGGGMNDCIARHDTREAAIAAKVRKEYSEEGLVEK